MNWTTPADLRAQVQKLWERGVLLAGLTAGESFAPLRLQLRGPTSRELAERFAEVRSWIARLAGEARFYRVVWRTVNHRILGANAVPVEIWIDSLEDALGLIGRSRDAERFAAVVTLTRERQPALLPWLAKRPLRALELAEEWVRLLEIVTWLHGRPRPGIYPRQLDIPGVHSKFIEAHQGVLGELFELALPPDAIAGAATGAGGFCRRFGFLDKPLRVRFRVLDPILAPLPTGTDQDLTVTHDTFARLEPPVKRIFITENEINFLAFPMVPGSIIIFGAGYGFDSLVAAEWLRDRDIHYWGDLDTHGFAILDQLRAYFPGAASLLMDRATLLAHRPLWGVEPSPKNRDLARLTGEEHALYDDLRHCRLGDRVRLEQERIRFGWVKESLGKWRD